MKKDNRDEYIAPKLEQESASQATIDFGPGQVLADARVAKGITIETVAAELNVTEKVINALERDDYEGLPPPIFVRGYLRNYANFIGVSAEDVLEKHTGLTSASIEPTSSKKLKARSKNAVKNKGSDKSAIFIVILLLAVLAGLGYFSWINWGDKIVEIFPFLQQQEQPPNNAETSEDIDSTDADSESQQISVLEDPLSTKIVEEESLPQPIGDSESQNREENGQESSESGAQESENDSSDSQAQEGNGSVDATETEGNGLIAASTQREIMLKFSGKSYVYVRDAAKKVFANRVYNNGETKRITAEPPVHIRLGDPTKVNIIYNGLDYDMGEIEARVPKNIELK